MNLHPLASIGDARYAIWRDEVICLRGLMAAETYVQTDTSESGA